MSRRLLWGGLCAAALLSGQAQADIRDVRIGHGDGVARVEVMFDVPVDADFSRLDDGEVSILGATARPSQMQFGAAHAPIRGVSFTQDGDALRVQLDVSGGGVGVGRLRPGSNQQVLEIEYAVNMAAAAKPAPMIETTPPAQAMATPTEPMPKDMPPAPASTRPEETAPAAPLDVAAEESPAVLTPPRKAASGTEPPKALSIGESGFPTPAPSVAEAVAASLMTGGVSTQACDGAQSRVEADAWDMEALVDYGVCLAADEDYAGAQQVFRRLLSFDPYSYRAHVGLAAASHSIGDVDLARRHYSAALNNDPPAAVKEKIDDALAALAQ